MANKISHVQKVLMLEWFENPENKRILNGASHSLPPDAIKRKWQDLAEILNSCGCGPPKTAEKWRRTFTELRCHIKKKQRCILADYKKTGGGPPKATPLTDLEERYLKLFGRVTVDGLEGSVELGVVNLEISQTQATAYRLEEVDVEDITVENIPSPSTETPNIRTDIAGAVSTPNIRKKTPRTPAGHSTTSKLVDRFETAILMQAEALNNIAAAMNRMADSNEAFQSSIVDLISKFLNK